MTLNRVKLQNEFGIWFDAFRDAPQATHFGGTFANRCVEACRASPYAGGHVLVVSLLLSVFEAVGLLVRVLL